jgi:hypothetical protein
MPVPDATLFRADSGKLNRKLAAHAGERSRRPVGLAEPATCGKKGLKRR